MSPTETNCRICGGGPISPVGVVEYIVNYAWTVYDCSACGCRFTNHENAVYDLLHQFGAISYYQDYRDLAAKSKRLFDRGDLAGLRRLLTAVMKYKFVIDEVERAPAEARLLEVGCSRGYLTSYFILSSRNILGIDVSSEALNSARVAFGDHFALAESPQVMAGAPYDIIYHVGMIGCVADPLQFTRTLMTMLKPGGKLIFNAPNRAACRMKNQVWFDSAPPPDVVTLFPPGFWARQFSQAADVSERIDFADSDKSFAQSLLRRFGPVWVPPAPRPMVPGADALRASPMSPRGWELFKRAVSKAGRITGLARLVPREPTEFGLLVKLKAKESGG